MQAAVDSVDERSQVSPSRPRTDPGSPKVRLLDEHELPPVTPKRDTTSFAGTLSATFGPLAGWTWLVLREAILFIALFWTVTLLMAATAPGLATLASVITGTVVLRVAMLAATRSRLWNRTD